MNVHIDAGTVLGVLGVAFSLASFAVKRMMALRVLAMIANVFFIGYGWAIQAFPGVILNCVLLPMNARRVWEIRKLSREIAKASEASPPSEWLLPHMQRRKAKKGDVLFRKGAPADRLIYIASGELMLVDIQQTLGPGDLLGEIGLFAPEKRRTQTAVCETDLQFYEMTDEMLFQLYYQDPKIGFYMVRLIAARLLRDIQRQQTAARAA